MRVTTRCLQCRTELLLIAPQPGVPVVCPNCGLTWTPAPEELRPAPGTLAAPAPRPVPARPQPRPRPARPEPEEPVRRGSNALAWVVLVGMLVLLGGGGVAAWLVFAKKPQTAEADPPSAPASAGPTDTTPKTLTGEQVYRRLIRSTVFILVVDQTDGEVAFIGCGSGALVHQERRLVVTNYHVVEKRDRVNVFFAARDSQGELITTPAHYVKNAKSLRVWGRVVARDSKRDLAVLELDRLPEPAAALPLAAKPAATNANVWSVGASGVDKDFSGALWRSCSGTVTNRYKDTFTLDKGQVVEAMFLQTQKPVNSGDSGGPTVNDRCELVGVVSSGHLHKNLVNHDIDVTEVRAFLAESAKKAGWVWDDGTAGGSVTLDEPEDVAKLIGQLNDPAADKRLDAANRLGALGIAAKPAFPALLGKLDDTDDRVRRAVASALPKLGPPSATDLGSLEAAIRTGGPNARRFALGYYAEAGRKVPEAVVPDVVAVLSDPSAETRGAAVQVLANYGPGCKSKALAAVLERTADEDPKVAATSERLFQMFVMFTDEDREVLIKFLAHEKAPLRLRAVRALAGDAPACKRQAFAALFERVADDDPTVAAEAAKLLDSFAPLDNADRAVLVKALTHEKAALRLLSVQLLIPAAPDADTALKWFRPRLNDTDARVRAKAVAGIAKWGAAGKDALSDMIVRTRDANPETAAAAVRAIGKMDSGRTVVFTLERLYTEADTPTEVRDAAAETLLSLDLRDPVVDLPVLVHLTTAKKPAIRAAALAKIAGFGKEASRALDAITARLTDDDAAVRAAALNAVAAVGPDAAKTIPEVAKLLTPDEPEAVSLAAASTLGKLGPKAIEPLARALSQKFPEAVLDRICDMLGGFGKAAQEQGIPALLDALFRHESLGKRAAEMAAVVRAGKVWVPDPVSRALTKIGGEELVKQLIKYTGWTARGKVKKTDHPEAVNFWAIVVLGEIDPATLSDAGKKLVADRLDYLASSDPDASCRAAAKAGQVLHPPKRK